ncbi:MAG: ribosomal L7Ae/L30e/S12e/Gadd45 family protein [Lachnospiraceae bacterium]|nr:ribosomal L7Ae/L30e/S12e/Gadd45 family protein [Lachnospiraceae bacterium]
MVISKVYGLLGLCTKAGGLVSGTDICIETIDKRKARLLLVATDAAERTKENFKYLANQKNVTYLEFGTIEELSKSIGKNNKAVICITNKNLAQEVEKIICGGVAIG